MRYVGGKFRQAKVWAPLILSKTSKRSFYLEPFVGGGSSLAQMAPHFDTLLVGDTNTDLMLMWQALKDGWAPPDSLSKDEYTALESAEPSALRGFAGFGCSLGGRFFGSYARSNDGRNYAAESKRSLLAVAKHLHKAVLLHSDFTAWAPAPETVVYADPPYAGVEGFGCDFNTELFWNTMRKWRDRGASVFVSEYQAPDDWTCVSELDLSKGTAKGKRQLDKLFC